MTTQSPSFAGCDDEELFVRPTSTTLYLTYLSECLRPFRKHRDKSTYALVFHSLIRACFDHPERIQIDRLTFH